MKASIAHGVRPSVLVLGKDSHETVVLKKGKLRTLQRVEVPWSRTDVVLARAYQRFLNELCGQCGLPKYICHTSDNRVQFRKAFDDCASAAVGEAYQHARSKMKDPQPEFGRRVYGEPYLTKEALEAGMEMSDFRRPYLIERAKLIAERDALA